MTPQRQDVALTFVIPVRHQDNARDWTALKRRLTCTLASIAQQDCNDWRAVVVANHGADLPDLPERIAAVRVDFPPNARHELGEQSYEEFYDAVRWDKGRRILSGMLAAPDTRFYMIVDDDDFVSNRLASFVREHPDANGWKIKHGYVWGQGGRLVMKHHNFHFLCGTSLIVNREAYRLPPSLAEADVEWVKNRLGSHVMIDDILVRQGNPLGVLPFFGAVYRIGHEGSHSRAAGLVREHIFNPERRPREVLWSLRNLRWLTPAIKREFSCAR